MPKVWLAGPKHCGSVPVKSTISSSPRMTSVPLIFHGRSGTTPSSSSRPSAVYSPSGQLAISARMSRSDTSLMSSQHCTKVSTP